MPTEEMFWGTMRFSDGKRVPLCHYRCKSNLGVLADGVNKPTGHRCNNTVDHEGEHSCLCGKRWKGRK